MYSQENPLITAAAQQRKFAHYEQRLRAAIQLDFDLIDEDLEFINSLYEPQVVLAGTGTATAHPVAAAHQRVAYYRAYKWAKPLIKGGKALIEIGPNPSNMLELVNFSRPQGYGYVHGCCKPDGRDQTRYKTSLQSQRVTTARDPDYSRSITALCNGTATNRFCTRGTENCDFQAQCAVAIHSLYDVSFAQLAACFERHGLEEMRAWMHFPIELLECESFTNVKQRYRFVNFGEETYFSFTRDASFGYQHNTKTWKNWMKCGGLDTPYGFSISIERTQFNGSQFELRISRQTFRTQTHFYLPSVTSDLVAIPDFEALAARDFCTCGDYDPPKIYTSASKVSDIYSFLIAREDTAKSFNIETVTAYARTKLRTIRFGGKCIEERWDISPTDYTKVCTAIYLFVRWALKKQRVTLNAAMTHMGKADQRKSWISWMFNAMRRDISEKTNVRLCRHNDAVTAVLGSTNKETACLTNVNNWFARVHIEFSQDILCLSRTRDHESPIRYEQVQYIEHAPAPIPVETQIKMQETINRGEHKPVPWAQLIGITAPDQAIPFDAIEKWDKSANHVDLETSLRVGSLTADNDVLRQTISAALDVYPTRDNRTLALHNCVILEGVPGAGKTTHICNIVLPLIKSRCESALFVAPNRAVRDEVREKLVAHKIPVHTVHTAMRALATTKFDYVIVDEAFTHPTALINWFAQENKVILLGDRNQVGFIDFQTTFPSNVPLADFSLPCMSFRTSRRCPGDVVALPLFQRLYPGIRTKNPRALSIKHITRDPENFKIAGATNLTFLQEHKNVLVNRGYQNVLTVAEAQGRTYPTVVLHYGGTLAEKNLIQQEKHLVVGLSRHTEQLYVCDATGTDIIRAINDDLRVAIPADKSAVNVNALSTDNRTPICDSLEACPEPRPYPTCSASYADVDKVLEAISPIEPRPDYYSVITTDLPEAPGAKGSLRPNELSRDDQNEIKSHKEYVWPVAQRVKITRPSNQMMSCKSILARLGKMTKNPNSASAKLLSDILFERVAKEFDFDVPQETKDAVFVDACRKFTERGHDLSELKHIATWTDQNVNIVKNFLKAQQKPSVLQDPLIRDKAGQGISAWSKNLNFEMMIYCRLLEHVLTRQSRGRVILATGMTDLQVLTLLEKLHQPNDQSFSNDWTEFDSSQNVVGRKLLARALLRIGCPEELVELFCMQLSERSVVDVFISVCAYDKKDSGAPHTLVDNCLFNLAVILDVLSDFRVLLIKGDDSIAFGENIRFNKDRASWYTKNCNYQFKPDVSNSGEFVSFIINSEGASYDLPRLSSKVFSRVYTSPQDFRDYRDAVGVTLAHNPLTAGLNMVRVNALHYGRPESEMDVLLSALHRFTRGEIPFSSLIKREQRQIIVDTAQIHFPPSTRTQVARATAPARYAAAKITAAIGDLIIG
nr:MAG: nonstructural polyprotein [Jingmen bat bastrovirus 1]